jgi:hypothetical protein
MSQVIWRKILGNHHNVRLKIPFSQSQTHDFLDFEDFTSSFNPARASFKGLEGQPYRDFIMEKHILI